MSRDDDRRHHDPRTRRAQGRRSPARDVLELAGLFADDDDGTPAIEAVNLKIKAGEIVGIAGVSGNGQSALVEVLAGQRPLSDGEIFIHGETFVPKRGHFDKYKVFGLPEEPLKNAAVPRMSVAENIAFRSFDKPPITSLGWWMSPGPMRDKARELIARYRVKTHGTEAPIETLSGGNVQRADPGARALRRRRRADRRQPLLRARLRVGVGDPQPDHGAAQSRRRGAAGERGSRRDPRARRPRRGDVGRHGHLCRADRGDRPQHDRAAMAGSTLDAGESRRGRIRIRSIRRTPRWSSSTCSATSSSAAASATRLGNDVSRLEAIVPTVAGLIALFREQGWPIIHTREAHRPDLSDCPPSKIRRGNPTLHIGETGAMGRLLVAGEPGNQIVAGAARRSTARS